jgi:hypothetical protein
VGLTSLTVEEHLSNRCAKMQSGIFEVEDTHRDRMASASKNLDCVIAHQLDQYSSLVKPVPTGQTGPMLLNLCLRFFSLGFVNQPRNPVVLW